MSFHSTTEFKALEKDLGALLLSTAIQFSLDCGLEPLSEESLRQMSIPIEAVASEMLMFGSNAWPESAQSKEDRVDRASARSLTDDRLAL